MKNEPRRSGWRRVPADAGQPLSSLAERQTDEKLAAHYRHLADLFEKNVHAEDDLLLRRPLDRARLRSHL